MIKKWYDLDEPSNLDDIEYVGLGGGYSPQLVEKLPEWISKCKNLTEIDVSDCCLSYLPVNLPESLKILNCSNAYERNNVIEQLPENLPNSLEVLICGGVFLKRLPKNLPNSLQYLECDYNKLTELPENLPNSLKHLDCSGNELSKLPKNIPNSLEYFECDHNELTELPENLPHTLKSFNCRKNKLTQLPKNLPYLLEYLICYENELTELPEKLPHLLKSLDCGKNKLTHLPENLPNSLRQLHCSNNKLTHLPMSIVQLRQLAIVRYDDNPIEYMPPVLSRFINNLRNTLTVNVYNDAQSVHNHNIQESIKKSIYNILKDKYINNITHTINEILDDDIIDEISKKALIEYTNDMTTHSIININFKDLLVPVWQRIQKHPHKDEIKKILNSEIKDGLCKCFTGRLSRLVNCLNGFCDDISIRIGTNEQIGNIVIITQQLLERENRYTVELHKELVRKELKEMDYEDAIINEWLEYI